MKRFRVELVLAGLAAMLAASAALAVKNQRLSLHESVALAGATHRVVLTHEDLTLTTTNGTAQTVELFNAQAKEGVELVAAVLKTAFLSSSQTGLVSVAVTVGDAADPDRYLTTTEVCSHGTEVWLKYGRGVSDATTTTLVYDKGGDTDAGTNVVVTAVVPAQNVYTTETAVNAVATPTTGAFGLDALTQGELWLYFRVIKAD